VESKLDSVDRFVVMRVLGPKFDGFAALPAVGTARGILVAWQFDYVQVNHVRIGMFCVTVTLCFPGGEPWSLTNHVP
jgi:hypothetical protein